MSAGEILARLDYAFKRPELLREALTHRSFGAPHNERLEFLGDSALNLAISQRLFESFPQLTEGELSRVRANLVNQQALSEIATEIGLQRVLRLGSGELRSGGDRRPSILADALEALVGAIFLDGGFGAAQRAVDALYGPLLAQLDPALLVKDPKTRLQEYLQARRIPLPEYAVTSTTGPSHDQQFEVVCVIPQLAVRTVGQGSSRRNAEQAAARAAYEVLTK